MGPEAVDTPSSRSPPTTPNASRRLGALGRLDDALRDRTLQVAAAAAVLAVLVLALLPGVPEGVAVVIGFAPSLVGGWLFLARAGAGPSQTHVWWGGPLLVAHLIAVVPVVAAILLAG